MHLPTPRRAILAFAGFASLALLVGWSTSGPLTFGGGANDQIQPKLGVASDGGTMLAWFDNASGGYDVRANRFDQTGAALWGANGVLIADRNFSSTVDYGAWVCSGNRFVVAYNDDRLGGYRISVSMLSASGAITWTKTVDSLGAYVASPKVVEGTDGFIYAAWIEGSATKVQKFDATTGTAIWPAAVQCKDGTATTYLCDLWPAADGTGGVMVSCMRYTTFTGPKTLRAFRVSGAGALGWSLSSTAPTVVFSTGSLQMGNFPPCAAVPGVGYVFVWYATSPLQTYVQLVDNSGAVRFGANGVGVTSTTTNERVSPTFAVDAAADRVYVTWSEHVPVSSIYGVGAQAFALSSTGHRVFGDAGLMLSPMATQYSTDFTAVAAGNGAATFTWQSSTAFGQDSISARRINADGTDSWVAGTVAVSGPSDKGRMAAVRVPSAGVYVWQEGATGAVDLLAQRIGDDRSVGGNPTVPADLNGDGTVDGSDLTIVLAAWGSSDAIPDINDDGVVNGLDLTVVLAARD